jgi:hypothetical protein
VDEQIEKEKITLKEITPAANERDPNLTELVDKSNSGSELTQTEPTKHASPLLNETSVLIPDSSQAIPLTEDLAKETKRSWINASLLWWLQTSYVGTFVTFWYCASAPGTGFKLWFDLVKFNATSLFSPLDLITIWQQQSSMHVLLILLVMYWCMLLLYPIGIIKFDIFDEEKSVRQRWLDAAIVVASFFLFLPLPCIPYWRYNGWMSVLNIKLWSDYEARKTRIYESLRTLPSYLVIPEFLAERSQTVINSVMLLMVTMACITSSCQPESDQSPYAFILLFGDLLIALGWAGMRCANKKAVTREWNNRLDKDSKTAASWMLLGLIGFIFAGTSKEFPDYGGTYAFFALFIVGLIAWVRLQKRNKEQ